VDFARGTCRGLLVTAGGTATIVDGEGNTVADVPLQTGYNPIECLRVNTGGNATGIFALY
jgi:hypothetical protein